MIQDKTIEATYVVGNYVCFRFFVKMIINDAIELSHMFKDVDVRHQYKGSDVYLVQGSVTKRHYYATKQKSFVYQMNRCKSNYREHIKYIESL